MTSVVCLLDRRTCSVYFDNMMAQYSRSFCSVSHTVVGRRASAVCQSWFLPAVRATLKPLDWQSLPGGSILSKGEGFISQWGRDVEFYLCCQWNTIEFMADLISICYRSHSFLALRVKNKASFCLCFPSPTSLTLLRCTRRESCHPPA